MNELLAELISYAGPEFQQSETNLLLSLLKEATAEVVAEMYPWGDLTDEKYEKLRDKALKRYGSNILKIAKYHYDKQGREGTTGWSESGTSISYGTDGTPSAYFRGIIPVAKIV